MEETYNERDARAGQGTQVREQKRKLELDDEVAVLKPIHPAQDVVDGVLYLTVQARIKGELQDVILTSRGEAFTREEWPEVCRARGLLSTADTNLEEAGLRVPRWTNTGINELQDGELTAPTWREAYEAIRAEFKKRLQLRDEHYYTVLALYAMATYFHALFEKFPFLHLRGPAESGKSRAASVVASVSFNGVVEGSTTPAAVFRKAHHARPTLVMTEMDSLKDADSGNAFVAQLQACHTRSEATVTITQEGPGKKRTPITYQTFSPRVFLSTQRIKAHPLRTRCIELDIVKQPNADLGALRKNVTDDEVWMPLRDKMYRLVLVRFADVTGKQEELNATWTDVMGRAFDKWLPLASIAALVSAEVLAEVQQLAREAQAEDRQEAGYADQAAILFKFAAYEAREHQPQEKVRVKRDDLYRDFNKLPDGRGFGAPGPQNDDTPQWAVETNASVSRSYLKNWIKGPQVLIKELRRLNLIEKAPHDPRWGDGWILRPQHVLDTVQAYIGDSVFADVDISIPEGLAWLHDADEAA